MIEGANSWLNEWSSTIDHIIYNVLDLFNTIYDDYITIRSLMYYLYTATTYNLSTYIIIILLYDYYIDILLL